MGYLHIPATSLPNFNKAVISLWFKIPAAVLTAVSALTDSPGGEEADGFEGICFNPRLYKIIPLITFDSLETGTGDATGVDVQPSFIGVDCSFVGDGYPARVACNLQTAATFSFNKPPEEPQNEKRPACYYMNGYGYEAGSHALTVIADQVHHILISFDISEACSITYANFFRSPPDPAFVISRGPTFYWSFDDQGKTNKSMLPSWALNTDEPAASTTHNYIAPNGFFSIWTNDDLAAVPIEDSTDFTVSLATSNIVSSGNPIGIPTSAEFVDNVYNISLGELQIFTGVTRDATLEASRRLFVKEDGTPEDLAVAAAELGDPVIVLHGATNWKVGNNTGSLDENFTKNTGGTINTATTMVLDLTP